MRIHSPVALPLAAIFALSLPGSATAGADEFTLALSEADFYADIPDVVSATRMPQKLTEAPASISIIDREMIRASGAINIPDLFRLVPGFQAYHVNSNKFGVTYHGASDDHPRRLEVMVDGRSVYLPLLSTVDWNSLGLALDDIERIEVVRGSSVPAYGSNAFLGAINIVTRSPYSESGATLKLLGGSHDTRRVEGRFGTSLGSSQTRVSVGHDQNDGSERFRDGARGQYLNLSSSLAPTIADTLSLQAGFTDGYAYRGDLDSTDKPIVKREHRSNYQYLRWDHLRDIDNEIRVSAYHNYLNLSTPTATVADLVQYEGLPAGLAAALLAQNPDFRLDNEHGRAELYDLELQHTYRLLPERASLLWGLGYRHETASSEVLLQDRGRIEEDRWRLFGNLELSPSESLTLNLGSMVETSTTSSSGARLSPRAALNFRPDRQSVFRVAYSQAYRMPSLLEENSQFTIFDPSGNVMDRVTIPNTELGPERIRTSEVGYYRAFTSLNGHFDARIFREEVEQVVDSYRIPAADIDSRIRQQYNGTAWQNDGLEFQLRLQPASRLWFLLNYAYVNTTDFIHDEGPADDGLVRARLPQTPLHTASALLNLSLPARWELSLAQYYVDEVQWDEGGFRDSYNRTDLRLGKSIALGPDHNLQGALIMQNFLGNEYSEFYEFNRFDRRTYLQLTLDF
ncbi:TonB-dependent receptor plug domain-containing protein [Marinobacterium aestuariivivens]|uniref:TonB-dependent receptor plug domain-containing protein n=1 Tax=Marinobacterium aestuariivivens TaxID=1698799 RepID=A0ABW2A1P2_9GAMM